MQNTVRQVFGAFGVAVIGTVLATRYATAAADALAPLPAQARGTAAHVRAAHPAGAAEGGGGRCTGVGHRPHPVGAFDAFLSASHFTYWISTIVIIIAALVVFFVLPQITPPSSHAEPPAPAETPRDAVLQEAEADAEASVVPLTDEEAHLAGAGARPDDVAPETS